MTYGRKKVFMAASVLLICISVFCSFVFIAGHADHDCTYDDDCIVCHVIADCVNTMRTAATNAAVVSLVLAVALLCVCAALFTASAAVINTLISLKVELRN